MLSLVIVPYLIYRYCKRRKDDEEELLLIKKSIHIELDDFWGTLCSYNKYNYGRLFENAINSKNISSLIYTLNKAGTAEAHELLFLIYSSDAPMDKIMENTILTHNNINLCKNHYFNKRTLVSTHNKKTTNYNFDAGFKCANLKCDANLRCDAIVLGFGKYNEKKAIYHLERAIMRCSKEAVNAIKITPTTKILTNLISNHLNNNLGILIAEYAYSFNYKEFNCYIYDNLNRILEDNII